MTRLDRQPPRTDAAGVAPAVRTPGLERYAPRTEEERRVAAVAVDNERLEERERRDLLALTVREREIALTFYVAGSGAVIESVERAMGPAAELVRADAVRQAANAPELPRLREAAGRPIDRTAARLVGSARRAAGDHWGDEPDEFDADQVHPVLAELDRLIRYWRGERGAPLEPDEFVTWEPTGVARLVAAANVDVLQSLRDTLVGEQLPAPDAAGA